MTKVNLFDVDIELDKTIYVSLDGSMDLFTMFPESMKDYCYAGDFKRLCQFIKEKRPCIITCLTKCVSVQIMELGYEIIVQSGNKFVKFSELLNGDSEKLDKHRIGKRCYMVDVLIWTFQIGVK